MTLPIYVEHGDLNEIQFKNALHAESVAWDIETSGLDWISDRIGTCQINIPDYATVIVKVDARPGHLVHLIEDPSVVKVFHHAPFDVRFMMAQWQVRPANIACTKIASKLLRPQADPTEHSLAALTLRLLGKRLDKRERTSDWLAEELTEEQLAYAAADVTDLLRLWQALCDDIAQQGLGEFYLRCLDHVPTRAELDIRGCPDLYAY